VQNASPLSSRVLRELFSIRLVYSSSSLIPNYLSPDVGLIVIRYIGDGPSWAIVLANLTVFLQAILSCQVSTNTSNTYSQLLWSDSNPMHL
jgi:hypothetical protein